MVDRYKSFAELSTHEVEGIDYSVTFIGRRARSFLIAAPHAGVIEVGTSAISELVAAKDYSLYRFESHKIVDEDYVSLHLTSHIFDEPVCINATKTHETVVTIHGCNDCQEIVYLGGLDRSLIGNVAQNIRNLGVDVRTENHRFPGVHHKNICNRGFSGAGIQVELSEPLRRPNNYTRLVPAIRRSLKSRLATI